MNNEKKTTKELIADVFDSAPKVFDSATKKEPNAFEVFDDPKPTQNGNGSIPAATWNPSIANMPRWTITSINTTNMPMLPVNMQFNLNCIRKGDPVVVNIWRYEDAGRVVSQATLNGSISDITPELMVIDVVNPLNNGDTEITISPSDMINNDHIRYTINCGVMSGMYYYPIPNVFGCNDPRVPWNQPPQF